MKFRPYIPYLFISLVYIISRLLFYRSGIRFDTGTFHTGWQFLDTYLLKNNLAESLLYLHSQPPLMNLLGGLALKISDTHYTEILWSWYMIIGLCTALLMYDILVTLRVKHFFAFPVTIIFMCSPSAILYENWFFYSHLEPFFILALIWGTTRYFSENEYSSYLWIALISTSLLCLSRSMFHLIFLMALIFFFLIFSSRKKMILSVSLPSLLLVGSWYFKNWILFGTFSASSWFGMNFARMSYNHGTPLGQTGLWQNIEFYEPIIPIPPYETLPEAVSAKYKRNNAGNYNHIGYIIVSKQFQKEAIEVFKHYPAAFGISVSKAFQAYFEPSSQVRFLFLEGNRFHIKEWCRIYNYGFDSPVGEIEKSYLNINKILYLLALFIGAAGICFSRNRYTASIILLCMGIGIYITMTGILFEYPENSRFRYPTIPLVFIVFSISVSEIVKKIVDLRKQILT